MADIPLALKDAINTSDLTQAISPALSSVLGPLMPVFQAIGIIFIIYIAFLIIKSILSIRQALRERSMAKNISEINEKLSEIIERLPAKKSKSKK